MISLDFNDLRARLAMSPAVLLVLAAFILLRSALPVAADSRHDEQIYRQLRTLEKALAKAVQSKELGQSQAVTAEIEKIDAIGADQGCATAAAYLAYLAVFAEQGVAYRASGNSVDFITMGGVERGVAGFTTGMRACEKKLKLPKTDRPPFVQYLKD